MDMDARRSLTQADEREPGHETDDERISREARAAFLATYDLPEHQPRVPAEAAREFLADEKAGRLPKWALKAVRIRELRAAARR